MTLELALNILIVLLLAPTIAYAVILNRKLSDLRKNRDDLAKVINSFNEATMRAEAGIPKLRMAADEAGRHLRDQVEKSQALRDDLAYMIERGEQMADRLEGAVRQARSEAKPTPQAGAAKGGATGGGQDLDDDPLAEAKKAAKSPFKVSLDDRLDRGRDDKPAGDRPRFGRDVFAEAAKDDGRADEDERSAAERELLRALQSAR